MDERKFSFGSHKPNLKEGLGLEMYDILANLPVVKQCGIKNKFECKEKLYLKKWDRKISEGQNYQISWLGFPNVARRKLKTKHIGKYYIYRLKLLPETCKPHPSEM